MQTRRNPKRQGSRVAAPNPPLAEPRGVHDSTRQKMKNTRKNSLLWEERVVPEMTRMAWPIALSMISYAAATLIDTIFVSPLGADALAGVSLGGVVAFTCISFALGALRGIKVATSHAVGAGQAHRAVSIRRVGTRMALLLGLTTAGLAYALSFALSDITKSAEAGEAAATYLSIRALGMPLVLVYAALREYRQALGDSIRPMIAVVAGNLLNIALDYVFIVLCEWGVAGAAWATAIAHSIEAFLILGLVRHAHRLENQTVGQTSAEERRDASRTVWRLGWPLGLQFVLESSSFTVMALLLAGLDSIHLAAHQIVIQVIHLTFLPLVAVSDAGSILAGHAMGAGRTELIRRVTRVSLLMGLAYATFCTVMLGLTNRQLVAVFTTEAELGALVSKVFWIAAAFQLLDAIDITTRGVLRGVGDVRFSAAVGVVSSWLILPPGTYLLGYMMGWGVIGAWAALAFQILVSALILRARLSGGRWNARGRHQAWTRRLRPWTIVRARRSRRLA